jgi:hypothetical protein
VPPRRQISWDCSRAKGEASRARQQSLTGQSAPSLGRNCRWPLRQFVLVNEAVNLGIAIYDMRQGGGIRYETLFRDETVGALDAVNGKEYVRMLRRAMDLGGLGSTKPSLSAIRHLFGNWRTISFSSVWLCGFGRPGSGCYQ